MKILTTLCAVLVLSASAYCVEVSVTLKDSITVADTAAASVRRDTLYTPVVQLLKEIYWAQVYWGPVVKDTNFTGDSLNARIQYATTESGPWTTFGGSIIILNGSADLDTFVNRAAVIDRDSAFTGNYWRGMFIYHDSAEATQPARLGNVYTKRFELRFSEVK